MSPPPTHAPSTSSAGKIVLAVVLCLGGAAFFGLMIYASVLHAMRDPVEDMRRANEVALKIHALAPALRSAGAVPATCPRDLRPHRVADGGTEWPPPVIDASELARFAPPDAGLPAPGSPPRWRFTDHFLDELKPWQDPRFDRDAALSADAADHFERGYVIVVEALSVDDPRVDRALIGQDTFVAGHVRGRATLFDLDGARPLCRAAFEAENSDDVKWRQGDSYVEEAVHRNLTARAIIAAEEAIKRIAPGIE